MTNFKSIDVINGFGDYNLLIENSHQNDFLPACLMSDCFSKSIQNFDHFQDARCFCFLETSSKVATCKGNITVS